jgi:hypothetical protein
MLPWLALSAVAHWFDTPKPLPPTTLHSPVELTEALKKVQQR